MAPAMGLALPAGSKGQHLLVEVTPSPAADSLAPHPFAVTAVMAGRAGTGQASGESSSGCSPDAPTLLLAHPGAGPAPVDGPHLSDLTAAAELLTAGIHDITDTLAGDAFRLNQVLRMVLETMYRALGFQRIIFPD